MSRKSGEFNKASKGNCKTSERVKWPDTKSGFNTNLINSPGNKCNYNIVYLSSPIFVLRYVVTIC